MQRSGSNTTLENSAESPAALWLRLKALLDAVNDVRSAALVVSNMARYKKDRDLAKLAEDLHGVHSTLHCRFDEVLRELRQCPANDRGAQSEAQPHTSDAA